MQGSAVLVHGSWSHPEEWRWVIEGLRCAGVETIAVDLPSHQSSAGTHDDDVHAVEEAISSLLPPVVAVGWSYGGTLLTQLAVATTPVARLVHVASVPMGLGDFSGMRPANGDLSVEHFAFPDEHTMVLLDDWWHDGSVAPFTDEVIEYFHSYPRRPMPLDVVLAPAGSAQRSIPTTLILGSEDNLHPPEQQVWATRTFDDVRIIDCDHFIPVRAPEVIVGVVLEALAAVGP